MPDMKITINLDQGVYDAIAAALPKYRVETTDPDNPNRSTIAPRWDSPEAWIEYVIETQAAPFLADRPKPPQVALWEDERKRLDKQIKEAMSTRVKVSK